MMNVECGKNKDMKRTLLYIIVIAAALSSCRPKGDVYFDPNDPMNMRYTTYAGQFEAIWKGLSTHYVFWSEDSTNWDAVYKEMLPRFEELDKTYEANGTTPDSAQLVGMYAEVTSTLCDHHMKLYVRDVHTGQECVYRPGYEEVLQRDYVVGQKYSIDDIKSAINSYVSTGLLDGGQFGKFGDDENFFGTLAVDGKKIAYLWVSAYHIGTTLAKGGETDEEKQFIKNIQDWLDLCLTDENLLGIILDNRCNKGGLVKDLDIVIGSFISEPLHYADLRYKEGVGRYDYTDWIPAMVDTNDIRNRRDLTKENIPYVALTNAFSISMAEVSSAVVKMLPTGRVVGERTFGAHGQSTSYSTLFHDGAFGDVNGNHYVHISNLQTRFKDDGVLEGVGITPTKSILQAESGYRGAMEKAIDYIKAY